jgi:hypothetical protein
VGHGGYSKGEAIVGFSAEVEKPQERPEGGNQFLGRGSSTMAGSLQKEVSKRLSIPLADILSQRSE